MTQYPETDFHSAVLDSIVDQIAVINSEGNIVFTNRAWNEFAINNNYKNCADWSSINYLSACDKAKSEGDDYGFKAAEGIRKVIQNELTTFYLEYPCNSPTEIRWFLMRITSLRMKSTPHYVISHSDITERKLAQEAAEALSRIDSLTNIPNRRYFNDFLKNEWLRCKRLNSPISLAIIDIDHFKQVNDTYGHSVGDESLRKVSAVIDAYSVPRQNI